MAAARGNYCGAEPLLLDAWKAAEPMQAVHPEPLRRFARQIGAQVAEWRVKLNAIRPVLAASAHR